MKSGQSYFKVISGATRLMLVSSSALSVVFLSAFVGSSTVKAQSVTVRSGQTVTNRQNLPNAGAVIVIEKGGTLAVKNTVAADTGGVNARIINRGLMTGESNAGVIETLGANSRVENFGRMETKGNAFGANVVDMRGGNSYLLNRGTMYNAARGGGVVSMTSNNNVFENHGTVDGLLDPTGGKRSVHMSGNNGHVLNHGQIIGHTPAIQFDGAQNRLTNTGTITLKPRAGAVDRSAVLFASGLRGRVVNSGSIIAPLSHYAINFDAVDSADVLTLKRGSRLQGRINFGTGADTLNVDPGMSLHYTFEPVAGGSGLPLHVNTGGAPFIRSGSQLMVFAPGAFGVAPQIGEAVAGNIFSVLADRTSEFDAKVNQEAGSGHVLGYVPPMTNPAPVIFNDRSYDAKIWGKTFGHLSSYKKTKSSSAYDLAMGGLVAGIDRKLGADVKLGAFAGLAFSDKASREKRDAQSLTGVGGIYGDFGGWAQAGLMAGYMSHDMERNVLNNMVIGGVEKVTGKTSGWMVSPQLTLGLGAYDLGGFTFRPSVRGRYVWQRQNGYTESGTGNVRVGSQTSRSFDARVQAAFDVLQTEQTHLELRTGLDVRKSWHSDMPSVTAFGQSVQFAKVGKDRASWGGFFGAKVNHQMTDQMSLYAAAEVSKSTDKLFSGDLRLGLSMKF